jgi:hypothetical protein
MEGRPGRPFLNFSTYFAFTLIPVNTTYAYGAGVS